MTHAPTSIDALQQVVGSTAPGPLRVGGASTKRRGHDEAVDRLDMRGVTGVVSYDPAECVMTARSGTPLSEMEAALSAHGQYLPFDPPLSAAHATIGGTVATAASGSCRYRYGGVRDFVIGARVVDGRGRLIASGGQVVKNAAGFLLHHALVGSAGRLGVIADVTFKVFPRPESRATVRARFATMADALAAHELIRAANLDLEALDIDTATATVWVRVAGVAAVQSTRLQRVRSVVGVPSDTLTGPDDQHVWDEAARFAWAGDAPTLVKVPAAPSRLLTLDAALRPHGRCRVVCGGAAILLAASGPVDALDEALRKREWSGVILVGDHAGRIVGTPVTQAFGDRVRATLDPDNRFS